MSKTSRAESSGAARFMSTSSSESLRLNKATPFLAGAARARTCGSELPSAPTPKPARFKMTLKNLRPFSPYVSAPSKMDPNNNWVNQRQELCSEGQISQTDEATSRRQWGPRNNKRGDPGRPFGIYSFCTLRRFTNTEAQCVYLLP